MVASADREKETEGTRVGWEVHRDKSQESAGVNTVLPSARAPQLQREKREGPAHRKETAGHTLPQAEKNHILLDFMVQKDTK